MFFSSRRLVALLARVFGLRVFTLERLKMTHQTHETHHDAPEKDALTVASAFDSKPGFGSSLLFG